MNKSIAMGHFSACIPHILSYEAGYVNHPADPGGETKYGISKRAYPHRDIAALTLDDATAIYERDYWRTVRADQFPAGVALLLFDSAINQGQETAVKLLQKALHVAEDGIPGPVTQRTALDRMPDLLSLYAAERARYYALLPTIRAFGRGWYRRLFGIYGIAWGWHHGD